MELAIFALGRAKELGMDVRINDPFNALRPTTVTSFVQEQCGGRALQIELPTYNREPEAQPSRAAITARWLEDVALRARSLPPR